HHGGHALGEVAAGPGEPLVREELPGQAVELRPLLARLEHGHREVRRLLAAALLRPLQDDVAKALGRVHEVVAVIEDDGGLVADVDLLLGAREAADVRVTRGHELLLVPAEGLLLLGGVVTDDAPALVDLALAPRLVDLLAVLEVTLGERTPF